MKLIILTLMLAAVVSAASPCTDPTYPISGTVTVGGSPIRNARVTARRSEDGYAWSALTNGFGYYRFTIPNCGTFSIVPLAKGYAFDPVNLLLPSDQFADGRTIDFATL